MKKYSDFEKWEMVIIDDDIDTISQALKEGVKKRYNLPNLAFYFFTSDIFMRYFKDMSLHSQSPRYVLEKFEREMLEKDIKLQTSLGMDPMDLDRAEWVGGTLVWWKHIDDTLSQDILKKIDYEWFCRYSLQLVYMQDHDYAIEKIMERLELQKGKDISFEEKGPDMDL